MAEIRSIYKQEIVIQILLQKIVAFSKFYFYICWSMQFGTCLPEFKNSVVRVTIEIMNLTHDLCLTFLAFICRLCRVGLWNVRYILAIDYLISLN